MVEILIALTIFSFLVLGIVSSHLFGMRLLSMILPKLQADGEALNLNARMAQDIESAAVVRVGTGDLNNFTPAEHGSPHVGNALELRYGTNAATMDTIKYYVDTSDESLKRKVGLDTPITLAGPLNNAQPFSALDVDGVTVLTDDRGQMLIEVWLDLKAMGPGGTAVGSGSYFRTNELRFHLAQRGGG